MALTFFLFFFLLHFIFVFFTQHAYVCRARSESDVVILSC